MKHKHILIITLFVFFFCTLAAAQTRRIEAKKKTGDSSALNNPELVFNSVHSAIIYSVAYSPDGKYLASGSGDKTIKLWEVETGRLLRTLTGHTGDVYSVSYSPNGVYLASSSSDKTIKIWEVKTGNCIKILTGHTGYVQSITYSPDGKYLASASWDKTIKLWEVETGECIKTLTGHTDRIESVAYSSDGKYVASASHDRTVKLWEVATGECVKTLSGHTDIVRSVSFAPNGKYFASNSDDETIKVWEVATGNCVKTLIGSESLSSVSYSPDGKYLVSASVGTAQLWEVESGNCIKTLSSGHIAYSPDGAYLASAYSGIKIFKMPSGECIKEIGSNSISVYSVAYSPDSTYLASASLGEVKLWETQSCKYIKALEGHLGYVYSVVYSPNGKYLASGSDDDNTIKLWEIATGECIRTLKGHSDDVNSVCYSPDGKYLASAAGNTYKCADKTVRIWEAATGKCVKTLEGHDDAVLSVCYSPDGKYIASGSADYKIKIWEAVTGKCIKTLTEHTYQVESVTYSPDGKYLASGSRDNTIKIWETNTWKCVKTLTDHKSSVTSVCYSPNGAYLASCSWDGTIKIWNVATEQCINTLTGHTGWVNSVCYSPDGAYLASGSNDDTIKFWDASTGDLLATTFNLKDGEWLIYTPEGFFAGSEWATKNLVHIVYGMKTVGIDQMYDSLYRPDLVSAKLSGEDISPYAQKVNFASLMQTGSAPVVTFLSLEDEVKDRDVTIEFAIQNTGGGIGEVNFLLNGKNIRLAEKASSKTGETVHFSHTITLQNGKNTVELYAKNEAGKVESLHVSKTLNWQGSVKKPNLYIFTVAINKYRDRRLQLKYAVPDAEFILKGFSSQKKSLYQNIFTHHLFDDNVTKDGVKSSFEKLGNEVQADDVFVFYIAGHGITYDEDGDYYYLPSNFRFINSEAIQQQGISKNDLTRYLSLIKAGKTLMLMDTCNAGSFLGNNTRGLSEQTAIDRLTRSTGHATIVASSDDQVAMEGYEGHGIFTYILVEGLRGKADTDGDGFITLQELSAYTEEEVPRRSYEKWGYEQTPMRNLRRQDFPIYTSGNR